MRSRDILIIDDCASLVHVLQKFFESLSLTSDFAYNGKEAYRKIRNYSYSLLILDIGLPDISGHILLERIREIYEKKPIIVISNDVSIKNEIESYRNGANIFHKKPLEYELLEVQVLNFFSKKFYPRAIRIKDLTLTEDKIVTKKGKGEIHLTKTEFGLLLLLAKNRGVIFSRDKIISILDALNIDKSIGSVDTLVCRLRKKLNASDCNKYIETVEGLGYRIPK
ncbi:MAG: response regulator transcription factor [Candidatus Dojkabacteria bacterium]|jgi:DNA-binding response OmpR family regulator